MCCSNSKLRRPGKGQNAENKNKKRKKVLIRSFNFKLVKPRIPQINFSHSNIIPKNLLL
jgi:hypothetical protein